MTRFIPKLFTALLLAAIVKSSASAQLYNNGSVMKITAGGSLFCASDFTNAGSSSFSNDGVITVQGNFVNSGTYNSTNNRDSLILSGAGQVTLNTGTAGVNNLIVNKASGGLVTLAANTNVLSRFELNSGGLTTNPATAFELIAPAAAIFSFGNGMQVIGKVRRTNWTNGNTVIFHQANMSVRTNNGTSPEAIMVNMLANGDPSGNEREVKRYFFFNPAGGTNYTADVNFPYAQPELNTNTENNLVPWYYSGAAEWNGKLTGNTVNPSSTEVSSTAIPANIFANNEWKLADPRYSFNISAILAGPWNGATMNTALNNGGALPLAQPFNTDPFSYTGNESVTAIPNSNVVDWVLVELRKPASGLPADAGSSTIIGRKAGFLLNNGTIVDTDGLTPVSFDISKQGPAFMAVRHMNHLGVLSNLIPSNALGTFDNDFTSLASTYKDPSSPVSPVTLVGGDSKYALWPGDANKNGVINATDVSAIKSAIAASATGYSPVDVNLSNSINATDVSLTKLSISSSASGSLGARTVNLNIRSSLPN
ncbi:hypothetical protein EXU57_19495 [Segetibacter sp. 3557_3]|uniref:dockerin type I domain-containing protein n=1 Tax=Segetibacter sp. 3557_3 TaxID=2547429 RepID=UPI001058A95A|nr:dockerin type I domain-containing protein [Segetibacter sp. 3557_3]TDH21386.1 hypothetical protein EXU57_19495 [Segetibacter sp. 3557_3]